MRGEIKMFAVVLVLSLLFVVGFAFFAGSSGKSQGSIPLSDQTRLIREDSYQIASDSAKTVTLVEFADFQCPACKAAYPGVKELLHTYNGKIRFIYRHFPLQQHKNSFFAAQASEAAGEQGKFWEMYDKLYSNQDVWSESNSALDIFTSYAKDLTLDTKRFTDSITANKFKEKIQRDISDGNAVGVNSTPTFFLNGKKLAVFPSNPEFKKAVDVALESK